MKCSNLYNVHEPHVQRKSICHSPQTYWAFAVSQHGARCQDDTVHYLARSFLILWHIRKVGEEGDSHSAKEIGLRATDGCLDLSVHNCYYGHRAPFPQSLQIASLLLRWTEWVRETYMQKKGTHESCYANVLVNQTFYILPYNLIVLDSGLPWV